MYQIERFHADGRVTVRRRNLTLEQAQHHCTDPETSSRTCISNEAIAYTSTHGEWFDGFRKMPRRSTYGTPIARRASFLEQAIACGTDRTTLLGPAIRR